MRRFCDCDGKSTCFVCLPVVDELLLLLLILLVSERKEARVLDSKPEGERRRCDGK